MRLSNALNPTFTEVMKSIRQENAVSRAENSENGSPFSTILANRQTDCPYGYLAKDGIIEYNGVVFVCDPKTNSICLGDMSDPKQVLNISLPSGGNLKINVNNFGDISRAVGMFSPEDLNAIMRAISQYNHCTRKLNEIEQEENEVMNVTQNDDEQYTGEATGETMNADMRATAASKAMLCSVANEFAPDMISKSQEMALSGDTSVGISETENLKECASLDEDENKKKIWTITAFTQEGIICTECPVGGSSRELWRIDYENPEDAEKVWEFLARFDKDADLKFARSQMFWEDFLTGSIDNDQIKM